MSASKPRAAGVTNPAKYHIKWKAGGDQGWFEYWDRGTKENVKMDTLDDFLICDKDLFSITGYVNRTNSSIMSNEVRTIDDLIIVKAWTKVNGQNKPEVVLRGSYSELKETVKDNPAYKYTKSIYIIWNGELCRLELSGAAFASWLAEVEGNANFET